MPLGRNVQGLFLLLGAAQRNVRVGAILSVCRRSWGTDTPAALCTLLSSGMSHALPTVDLVLGSPCSYVSPACTPISRRQKSRRHGRGAASAYSRRWTSGRRGSCATSSSPWKTRRESARPSTSNLFVSRPCELETNRRTACKTGGQRALSLEAGRHQAPPDASFRVRRRRIKPPFPEREEATIVGIVGLSGTGRVRPLGL